MTRVLDSYCQKSGTERKNLSPLIASEKELDVDRSGAVNF